LAISGIVGTIATLFSIVTLDFVATLNYLLLVIFSVYLYMCYKTVYDKLKKEKIDNLLNKAMGPI
jgi:membrane protein implicated in regulation of membrane protease activity